MNRWIDLVDGICSIFRFFNMLELISLVCECARVGLIIVWVESNKLQYILAANLKICVFVSIVCLFMFLRNRSILECEINRRVNNERYRLSKDLESGRIFGLFENDKFRTLDRFQQINSWTGGQLIFDIVSLIVSSVGLYVTLSDFIAALLVILIIICLLINMGRTIIIFSPIPVNFERISV